MLEVQPETEAFAARLPDFFDAIERGEPEDVARQLRELCTADVRFDSAVGGLVEGRRRGIEDVIQFFDELMGTFELRYMDRRFEPKGDDGFAIFYRLAAIGRSSGIEISYPAAAIWLIRDGRCHYAQTLREVEDLASEVERAIEEQRDA